MNNRDSLAPPSASQGIAAVAAQIQDRALQLSSEKTILELTQIELAKQQAVLDEAAEECAAVRKDYLTTLRMRHGVELEMWNVQGRTQECTRDIEKMQQEIEEMRADKQEIQSNWEQVCGDLLAGHHLKQEIYRYSLQTSLNERAAIVEKRQEQLQSLSKSIATLRDEETHMKREQDNIEKELKRLHEAERDEEKDLDRLAQETKEMIIKVRE